MSLWVGVAYYASIQVASLTLVRCRYGRFAIVENVTITIQHCFAAELIDYLKAQYPKDLLVVAVGVDASVFLQHTLSSKKRPSSRMLTLMIKHVVEQEWGCCLSEWQVKVFAKHPVYSFYGIKNSWLIKLKHRCQQANIRLSVIVPLELAFYHIVLVDNHYDAFVYLQEACLYWRLKSKKKQVKYGCQSFQYQDGDNQLSDLLSTELKEVKKVLLVSDVEVSELALAQHGQIKVRVFGRSVDCPASGLFSLLLANQAYVTF